MIIIAGLGNPGEKYSKTRHNVGFLVIDQINNDYNLNTSNSAKNNITAKGKITDFDVITSKPQSYMNLSGTPILSLMSFYKVPRENLIIFVDDVDLQFGKIKTTIGSSHAGHNGIKDINNKVGNHYIKVRIGVGRSENPNIDTATHVLQSFTQEELGKIHDISNLISNNIDLLLKNKPQDFQNKITIS